MEGERVVFSEETGGDRYLKLIAAGEMDDSLLEALKDYIKRQPAIGLIVKARSRTGLSSASRYARIACGRKQLFGIILAFEGDIDPMLSVCVADSYVDWSRRVNAGHHLEPGRCVLRLIGMIEALAV